MQTTVRLSKANISNQEIAAVTRVMQVGYLGMSTEVQMFEKELAEYIGGDVGVVCVNTGTSALHLAAQAIGLKPGDEVLVPGLTFVASFQTITAAGATPVACDVSLQDGLLDLQDAAKRITSKTKAIMPVHYASNMDNLTELYQFAQQHNLRVIEDAAHAFGCVYQNKKIGSFGDIVCFSFDSIKNITCGEGGAIVTRDAKVIQRVQDARLLGVEKDTEKRYQHQRSWDFDVKEQGWRYHMSDIMAAIGRVQLQRFEAEFKPKRMLLARLYHQRLRNIAGIKLFATDLDNVVPHILPIRVLDGKRDYLREALLKQNVQVGIHYKPAHLLTKFGGGKVSLPNVEQLYAEMLTLPMHVDLIVEDIDRIAAIMEKTLC